MNPLHVNGYARFTNCVHCSQVIVFLQVAWIHKTTLTGRCTPGGTKTAEPNNYWSYLDG